MIQISDNKVNAKEKIGDSIEYYQKDNSRCEREKFTEIYREINKSWIDSIAKKNPNGRVIIHSIIRLIIELLFYYIPPPFSKN